MTNQEAKKRLEIWLKCMDCPEDKLCYDSYLQSTCEYTDYCDDVSISEAIKVAIESLEQEPCDDAINRWEILPKSEFDSSTRDHIKCTNCGKEPFGDIPYMFCPNCGAKMESEEK